MNVVDSPFSLVGKTILITGASSGIGRACAIECAKMGARCLLMARREDRLKELSNILEGNDHIICSCDVSDFVSLQAIFDQISEEVNTIDGFVHSAGMEITTNIKRLKPKKAMELMNVNWLSALEITRLVTQKRFLPEDYSSIIYIASIRGLLGRAGLSVYGGSKGALIASAKSLAVEMAPRRVRVNTVSPGLIVTDLISDLLQTLDEEQYKKRTQGYLLGLGDSTDIANACVYLLSSASKWITGINLIVDGGVSINR